MCSLVHALLMVMAAVRIEPVVGKKANFERFEQFFGAEYIDFELRVRKYNRTTTVLDGTMHIRQPLNDTIVFSSDVFHSRIGNQQFQHYPMRLPTSGFCLFLDNMHKDYSSIIGDIVNIPRPGECPVSVRTMTVDNKLFVTSVLPDSLSPGLWKMVITGTLNGDVVLRSMFSVRLFDDYYF